MSTVSPESSRAEVEAWLFDIGADALVPPERLTVSEFADRYRVLSSKASREPGQWRTSRTPFAREIMDALSRDSKYETIVLQASSQIVKTEIGLNWMAYVAVQSPKPMMIVWPTKDATDDNVRVRVRPMIAEMPSLLEKIGEQEGPKDAANNLALMEFPGGYWAFAPSMSTAALKSKPICYVWADEVDEFPMSANQQGDPLTLIETRTRTFVGRRKLFYTSSPTKEGGSRIEMEFLQTDQRHYYVPCPFCGCRQHFEFENLQVDEKDPASTWYRCRKNGCRIENYHKAQMLPAGEWRPHAVALNRKKIGFHLNLLYAPVGMFSWEEIARLWIAAKDDPTKLVAFYNTVLGQSYKDVVDRPKWQELYDRRESYPIDTIPEGVIFLTAGADVQKDRIECEVVGWGRGKESWSIAYHVFSGDTSDLDSEAWHGLQALLNREYVHPTGALIQITTLAIDAGYRTQTVYDFAAPYPIFPAPKVAVIKGSDSQTGMVLGVSRFGTSFRDGKKVKRGVRVTPVGVSILKTQVYGWLGFKKPDPDKTSFPPGYMHFPEYTAEYFKQLCSEEQREFKDSRTGRKTYQWVKVKGIERNEALDCRIYARAAASILNIDVLNEEDWNRLESIVGTIREKSETPDGPAAGRRRSRFKSWRES